MTTERSIEIMESICLADAWRMAGTLGGYGISIATVADGITRELSKLMPEEFDGESFAVRDAIVDALDAHSEIDNSMSPEGGCNAGAGDRRGETMIGGDLVYWWDNNATTEWTTTMPEWW